MGRNRWSVACELRSIKQAEIKFYSCFFFSPWDFAHGVLWYLKILMNEPVRYQAWEPVTRGVSPGHPNGARVSAGFSLLRDCDRRASALLSGSLLVGGSGGV